jgi:hypothetical protein
MSGFDDKFETQRQWNADPCGADAAPDLEPGSPAFFARVTRYWVCTLLLRGILRGGLLRKGYRRLLSEIEHRSSDSDAAPLVQVVSHSDCRRLFGSYTSLELQTAHLDPSHLLPLVQPGRFPALRRLLERVARRWGWYLVAFAWK